MRGLGHHAGRLGPGGRAGEAGPVDQAGEGHRPRSIRMRGQHPRSAEPACVFLQSTQIVRPAIGALCCVMSADISA